MHYMEMLRREYACGPAMSWLASNAHLAPREQWNTCPDGAWQAWILGLDDIRRHLRPEALRALRDWAMRCAHRALTEYAPNALLAASACHPDERHRSTLLAHAKQLAGLSLGDPDARYAAVAAAAAADDARYDAAAAADDARYDAAVAAADAAAVAAARYDAARYDAAADARYAAVAAADFAVDAVGDADGARCVERQKQADDLRACIPWEWVEQALTKAGIELRTSAEASSPL